MTGYTNRGPKPDKSRTLDPYLCLRELECEAVTALISLNINYSNLCACSNPLVLPHTDNLHPQAANSDPNDQVEDSEDKV